MNNVISSQSFAIPGRICTALSNQLKNVNVFNSPKIVAAVSFIGGILMLKAEPVLPVFAASACMTYIGVKDLLDRKYLSAATKMTLGVCGIAASVFYIYRDLSPQVERTPQVEKEPETKKTIWQIWSAESVKLREEGSNHPEFARFIQSQNSIDQDSFLSAIMKEQNGWKKVGSGFHKSVYEHSALPGRVIKFPNERNLDLFAELTMAQCAQKTVGSDPSAFSNLALPDTNLVNLNRYQVLIAEKLDLIPYLEARRENPEATEKALNQFNVLAAKLRFDDMDPTSDENAGFIKASDGQIKLVPFDLDYVDPLTNPCFTRPDAD